MRDCDFFWYFPEWGRILSLDEIMENERETRKLNDSYCPSPIATENLPISLDYINTDDESTELLCGDNTS